MVKMFTLSKSIAAITNADQEAASKRKKADKVKRQPDRSRTGSHDLETKEEGGREQIDKTANKRSSLCSSLRARRVVPLNVPFGFRVFLLCEFGMNGLYRKKLQ